MQPCRKDTVLVFLLPGNIPRSGFYSTRHDLSGGAGRVPRCRRSAGAGGAAGAGSV